MAPVEPTIVVRGVNHFFGDGDGQKQILFDVSVEVVPGEIVIVTGPSGSGKTTLLTLIGGLRRLQSGSITIDGIELAGADPDRMRAARQKIGFIFQAHNLLASISAIENVRMSLKLHDVSPDESYSRAEEMLRLVGLGERTGHFPSELSGGQKQRVAIARALATRPRIILADEPTAALDKRSGRDVVDLMQNLAKQQGCSILLVTHDNRILDIADRIVSLEDGRLSTFTRSVISGNKDLMKALARSGQNEELIAKLDEMSEEEFHAVASELTEEFGEFLKSIDAVADETFTVLLDNMLSALALKTGQILGADRVTIFLHDDAKNELWSKVAEADKPLEIRIPSNVGAAGHAFTTGKTVNIPDTRAHPLFHGKIDEVTGYTTRHLLAAPILDRAARPIGSVELLNKRTGVPFDAGDEDRLARFLAPLGVILESWIRIHGRSRDPAS